MCACLHFEYFDNFALPDAWIYSISEIKGPSCPGLAENLALLSQTAADGSRFAAQVEEISRLAPEDPPDYDSGFPLQPQIPKVVIK